MPAPYAIFCADPLDPKTVEPDFAGEAAAAREFGFTVIRLDHDKLDRRTDAAAALRGARFDNAGAAVYRGWMLTAGAYEALYNELAGRGVCLVTSPVEYAACHHAPTSYPELSEWMPKMAWVETPHIDNDEAVKKALAPFGPSAVILKDWVKSQASGYWNEACYIADASDFGAARKTIERFRELQGESLVGGLVFKAYLPLTPVGLPAYEHRAFIVRGRPVGCWPRMREAQQLGSPPGTLVEAVARKIPSPFASADFGRDNSGNWWPLEIGDGQVSGLPDADAARAIFGALAN